MSVRVGPAQMAGLGGVPKTFSARLLNLVRQNMRDPEDLERPVDEKWIRGFRHFRTNDSLLPREWEVVDETVQGIAPQRLVGISDLISRGLETKIDGWSATVFVSQNMSSVAPAQMAMSPKAIQAGMNDQVDFDIAYWPLPFTFTNFNFDARMLAIGERGGHPLDTLNAEAATEQVSLKLEDTLFNGSGNLTFGGGTVYGYTDFPGRLQGSLTAKWTDSTMTGEKIVKDVLRMRARADSNNHFGDFALYVPKNYDFFLDSDYSSSKGDGTIRDRLKKIERIVLVRTADRLADDQVLLVELQKRTVQMITGLPIGTIEWEGAGALTTEFAVVAIQVPVLRTDQKGQSGIVHYAG